MNDLELIRDLTRKHLEAETQIRTLSSQIEDLKAGKIDTDNTAMVDALCKETIEKLEAKFSRQLDNKEQVHTVALTNLEKKIENQAIENGELQEAYELATSRLKSEMEANRKLRESKAVAVKENNLLRHEIGVLTHRFADAQKVIDSMAENLLYQRVKNGFTQLQVSAYLGIHDFALRKVESEDASLRDYDAVRSQVIAFYNRCTNGEIALKNGTLVEMQKPQMVPDAAFEYADNEDTLAVSSEYSSKISGFENSASLNSAAV